MCRYQPFHIGRYRTAICFGGLLDRSFRLLGDPDR